MKIGCVAQALLAITLLASTPAFADSAPTTQPDPELIHECDALLATAIVRPYGIAWAPNDPDKPRAPLVSYAPGTTPAAGWILWEAGRICSNPRYTRAAIDVARGIANSQEAGGKIPDTVRFGPADDRGQDTPQFIPNRASTGAALGLLLTILHDSPKPDTRLRSCTLIAVRWLARQQADIGAWPTRDPNEPIHNLKVIRLDNPDYRDSTLALLLASDVLKNRDYSTQATRGARLLLDLSFGPTRSVATGCWCGAYTLGRTPRSDIAGAPLTLDTLATRYCLQTLLAQSICAGDIKTLEGIHSANKTLLAVRNAEGTLPRYYPLSRAATNPAPSSPPDDMLPGVLNVVEQLDLQGLFAFGDTINNRKPGGAGTDDELARVLCGVGDDLFCTNPPTLSASAANIRQSIFPPTDSPKDR